MRLPLVIGLLLALSFAGTARAQAPASAVTLPAATASPTPELAAQQDRASALRARTARRVLARRRANARRAALTAARGVSAKAAIAESAARERAFAAAARRAAPPLEDELRISPVAADVPAAATVPVDVTPYVVLFVLVLLGGAGGLHWRHLRRMEFAAAG